MNKPKVKLVGEDGNVFAIIGRCSQALKKAGQDPTEFNTKCLQAHSYDEILRLAMQYCKVE